MKKAKWLLSALALLFCFSTAGQLADTKGEFTTNDVAPRVLKFKAEAGKVLGRFSVDTRPGTVSFEVRSPDGTVLDTQSAGVATMEGWTVKIAKDGEYELVVTPHGTAGHWEARILQLPGLAALYAQVASGALMMLVALAAVFAWWFHCRMQWRWFWAGAGIWTVGVALKFALAIPLNAVFFGKGGHVVGLKLCLGSIYCGLMTGIFEIGITLAAALVWRRLAVEPARAVAVGLGAGAFEALLLGFAACAGSLAALASGQADPALRGLAGIAAHTPFMWLTGPVERVIAILAHTASRVLVLRAVAGRRWPGFWAGFGWLSATDLVAGVALLSGMAASTSLWLTELMLLPFGLLGIPMILWATHRWPTMTNTSELQTPQPASAEIEQHS